MDTWTSDPFIAVRLEGGIGDHLLGMRVLRFVRERYPDHHIVVFSDAYGQQAQIDIAAMSPFVTRVVPIFHTDASDETIDGHSAAAGLPRALAQRSCAGMTFDLFNSETRGAPQTVADTRPLATLRQRDLAMLSRADLVIDAFGGEMFAAASVALDVPVFDILASRPELVVPPQAHDAAGRICANYGDAAFIGVHLAKHGAEALRRYQPLIADVLQTLLRVPDVVILNFFTSSWEYGHWPEPERSERTRQTIEEGEMLNALCAGSNRTVPCADLPLPVVAALLTRCRYFIGLDNGIKHLAWALQVPHSFFVAADTLRLSRALRWMPDLHRVVLLESGDHARLAAHIAAAVAAVSNNAPVHAA